MVPSKEIGGAEGMFEKEIAVYSKIKDGLPLGQFVLIRGDKLIGVFANDAEAVTEGVRRFGLESFWCGRFVAKNRSFPFPR